MINYAVIDIEMKYLYLFRLQLQHIFLHSVSFEGAPGTFALHALDLETWWFQFFCYRFIYWFIGCIPHPSWISSFLTWSFRVVPSIFVTVWCLLPVCFLDLTVSTCIRHYRTFHCLYILILDLLRSCSLILIVLSRWAIDSMAYVWFLTGRLVAWTSTSKPRTVFLCFLFYITCYISAVLYIMISFIMMPILTAFYFRLFPWHSLTQIALMRHIFLLGTLFLFSTCTMCDLFLLNPCC